MSTCSARIVLSGLAASAIAAAALAASSAHPHRVRPGRRQGYDEVLHAALGFANRQAVTTLWIALMEHWQSRTGRPLRLHPVLGAAVLSALGSGVDHVLRPEPKRGTARSKTAIIATGLIAALALVAGTRKAR